MRKWPAADEYIDRDSRFTTVHGHDIHYKRAGSGRAVLLLHGSASSLHCFDRVSDDLSSSFDVIRPDLPGFGLTGPRPDGDYRIETYATTVAAFLDSLDLNAVSIVGNSLGGNIAWNLAIDFPQRADRLVLINSTGYPDKTLPLGLRLARHPLTRMLLRRNVSKSTLRRTLRSAVGAESAIVDDPMIDRVRAMMMRPGNRKAFVDFATTEQLNRTDQIPGIKTPTLILRSAGVDGQHFHRDIPYSQELTNEQTGHLLPEEAPKWVATAIEEFLMQDDPNSQCSPKGAGQ